jgi:hypothetical protein
MAISTYAELQAAARNWLNRPSDLDSRIPEFIALAEARFNRTIWVPQCENSTTLTVSAETASLPADFRAARALYVVGTPNAPLEQVSPSRLRELYPSNVHDTPRAYAIIDDTLTFGPSPSSAVSVVLDYYQNIPALASNSTNWLLTAYPDLYLYATLVQAEAFGWNDERIGLWKVALDEALSELKEAGAKRRHNGPLSPRLGPLQFRYAAT